MNTAVVGNSTELFDPHAYFENNPRLLLSDSFKLILQHQKPMPFRGLRGVTSRMLTRRDVSIPNNFMESRSITEILGGTDEVIKRCATLDQVAAMIERQPEGEYIGEDGLATRGSNIFCAIEDNRPIFVFVNWRSAHRWPSNIWELDIGCYHCSGDWVFLNEAPVV